MRASIEGGKRWRESAGYIAGWFGTRHRGVEVEGMATGRCPKTRHCYCPSLHPFLSVAPNSDFGVHALSHARTHARIYEHARGTVERVNKRRLRLRRTRTARLTMRAKYFRVCMYMRACVRSLVTVVENVRLSLCVRTRGSFGNFDGGVPRVKRTRNFRANFAIQIARFLSPH